MKIVFLDTSTLGQLESIKKLNDFGSVHFYPTTSPEETNNRIKDAEVVITNKVVLDESALSAAKNLKLICIAATGMNNVDLEAAKEHNIVVKNAQNYSSESVAQSTFNALFYLIHQTNYYDQYVKNGQYAQSDIFTHIHHNYWEIKDKVFGIIGMGNIGQRVAEIASCFGAKVIYHSTSGRNNDQKYPQKNLQELLSLSKVVSIHAPLNENTKGLIGMDEIKKMQSDALLINMGRGGIVDESSLAKALDENVIGGAALDVLENEPIEKSNPLLHIKNKQKLYISPHLAWASLEARNRLIDIICQHLEEYKG